MAKLLLSSEWRGCGDASEQGEQKQEPPRGWSGSGTWQLQDGPRGARTSVHHSGCTSGPDLASIPLQLPPIPLCLQGGATPNRLGWAVAPHPQLPGALLSPSRPKDDDLGRKLCLCPAPCLEYWAQIPKDLLQLNIPSHGWMDEWDG